MKIISSSGKGNFKLIKNDDEVCELAYTNWFSEKAQTALNGNNIVIKPKNIWTSKVDIFKNESQIGDITFNLKGHMVIRLQKANGKEFNYLLKNIIAQNKKPLVKTKIIITYLFYTEH